MIPNDDAEKASFYGIEACLDFLEEASAPRKTVIFGLISDYPGAAREYYYKAARLALARADRVYFTGPQAPRVRRLAKGEFAGRLFFEEEPEKVFEHLFRDTIKDEVIYIKASKSTELQPLFVPNHETGAPPIVALASKP